MADAKREVEPGDDSDPEDSRKEWWLRRREASDDEDESSEGEQRAVWSNRRDAIASFDDELHGAGGAPEEEDVSYFNEFDALEREEEMLFQEEEENEGFSRGEEEREQDQEKEQKKKEELEAVKVAEVVKQGHEAEQKKKEKEALTVPIGAFYMHDDRFRGGRREQRMTFGRRDLRGFKDEGKWQHDKFEEMTLQESENKKFNAYAKRILDHYHQGYYKKGGKDNDVEANQFKHNANYDIQSISSRNIRGRGPVKYKPLKSSNDVYLSTINRELRKLPGAKYKPLECTSDVDPPTGHKDTRKLPGINSNADSARVYSHASKKDSSSLAYKKLHHHASSSNPNISMTNKRDVQPGKTRGNFPTTAPPGDNTFVADSNLYLQGKIVADSSGRGWLYAKELTNPVFQHHYTNLSLQYLSTTYVVESPELMGQVRDFPFSAPTTHHLPTSYNVDQVSPMEHRHVLQQTHTGSMVYSPLKSNTQQLSSLSGIKCQPPSPSISDLGFMEPFARPSESEITWAGLGSRIDQGCGKGYGFGETHAHQNFVTTTPLSPALQFIGQHLSDHGQHAVDRAVDRCVAQQQSGFGNSVTTWVHGLPDNVGFLSPHYVTPNGGHQVFSLGQESSAGITSNGAGADRPTKGRTTADRTEDANNQSGVRRSKLQRYSKMKFNH